MDLALILAVVLIVGLAYVIGAQAFVIRDLERQNAQASKNDTRDPTTGRYTRKRHDPYIDR